MSNTAGNQHKNYRRDMRYTGAYVVGNTVRKIQEEPADMAGRTRKKPVSQSAKRNRQKATSTSLGFMFFLAVICLGLVCASVSYLQIKSELTGKAKTLAALESEYSQLKADNDEYYSQVSSSADIEKIKAIAIKRLGMKYATDDQIITYETERSSYVKQYQDVPSVDR